MISTQESTIHTTGDAPQKGGCLLGNGKIAILTTMDNSVDVDRVVMTRDVDIKGGTYQPNVLDIFNTCRLNFFDNIDYATVQCAPTASELIMVHGCYVSEFLVKHLVSGVELDVKRTLYCIRNLPYSHMQTVEITPRLIPAGADTSINMFHEVYTRDNILTASYENSLKFSPNGPLHQFVGFGTTIDGANVAFASTYLFEGGSVQYEPLGLGFSRITSFKNYQFNAFKLKNLQEGVTMRFNIFTSNLTSFDFNDPKHECVSTATKICSQPPIYPNQTVAGFIKSGHTKAWDKLWKTHITITPKHDASPDQKTEVQAFNKLMNACLYNIYSSVRENYNMDVNTNSVSIIDIDGNLLYDSDMWLVPLLLIIRPDLARPLIEYRYQSLALAQSLAASYGLSGAKFPYTNDVIGYKSNVYYTTTSYMHVYNTCMAGINAWNYYRASRDRNWLLHRGFPILKEVANFVGSIVERDESTEGYVLRNVMGLNGKASDANNVFTNNLCKMVMRYAIEASYELKYDVPEVWHAIAGGIQLPRFNIPLQNVVRLDDAWRSSDKCDILEATFMFTPSYWQMIYNVERVYWVNVVNENLRYWETALTPGNGSRPTNMGLLTIMNGIYMSQYTEALDGYMGRLNDFIDKAVFGPWLGMHPDVRITDSLAVPYNASAIPQKNSLTTNAIFLMMIIQGICQAHLVGGVSDSRFYYEDLKVSVLPNATMPKHWSFITLDCIGMDGKGKAFDVRQNGMGDTYGGPDGGQLVRNRNILYDEYKNTP